MLNASRSRRCRVSLICVLAMAAAAVGCAETPPAGRGVAGGPPPQAIAACASRLATESCSFRDGAATIAGTCQLRAEQWVCVPDRGPPGGSQGGPHGPAERSPGAGDFAGPPPGGAPEPPPEAYAACQDSIAGGHCNVITPGGSVPGFCSAASTERLACIPSDPDHRPLPPRPGQSL